MKKFLMIMWSVCLVAVISGCQACPGGICQVTVAQAEAQIKDGDEFIIFFTQQYCPPCASTKLVLKGDIRVKNLIKNRYGNRLFFIDVTTTDPEQRKIVEAAKVKGTPTVVLLKKVGDDYNEIRRVVGGMNRTTAFKFLTGGQSDPNLNPYQESRGFLQRLRN